MRILVSVCHPVWVHVFRYAIERWKSEGAEVLVAAREKDCLTQLLDAFGMDYEVLSRAGSRGLMRLGMEYVARTARMRRLVRRFRPDVIVTARDPSAAQAGWLSRLPVVSFDDGETAPLESWLCNPFTTVICKAKDQGGRVGRKTREYNGLLWNAFLHPRYFRPDPKFRSQAGFGPDERIIVMRLVAWSANHDVGQSGIPDPVGVARALQSFGRVVISHERPLPDELQHLSNRLPPHQYQQLLYHADLLVAEGGNAAEAGLLGTPNVLLASFRPRVWLDLAAKGIICLAADQDDLIEKAMSMLQDPQTKPSWRRRAHEVLESYDDVTAYMCQVVAEVARRQTSPSLCQATVSQNSPTG
jgi:uncharacterized protein